jgi:hypothetical protein
VHRVGAIDGREAIDADVAARRHEPAGDTADERRLAGAVGAEQPEGLAGLDAQVDTGERLERAEAPDELFGSDRQPAPCSHFGCHGTGL